MASAACCATPTPRRRRVLFAELSAEKDDRYFLEHVFSEGPAAKRTRQEGPESAPAEVAKASTPGKFATPAKAPAKVAATASSAAATAPVADEPATPVRRPAAAFSSPAPGRIAVADAGPVGSYPLAERERECAELDRFLARSLATGAEPGLSNFLWVSGGPGTGKTCSVRAATAAYRRQRPETLVLEVNCMGSLHPCSISGLLKHVAEFQDPAGCAPPPAKLSGLSVPSLAVAAVVRLAQLAPAVVLIVDEADQLALRGGGRASSGAAGALETLMTLPQLPGAPPLAVIAIANAVDLLERSKVKAPSACGSLLFAPYTAAQLRNIVRARLAAESGGAGLSVAAELRVRQVAKQSGDCRRVLGLCEEAAFESEGARQAADATRATGALGSTEARTPGPAETPVERTPRLDAFFRTPATPATPGRMDRARMDPAAMVQELPTDQQVLLCALASTSSPASGMPEICARFRELCKRLHLGLRTACRQQVGDGLAALEQRGLLRLAAKRGAAGRGRQAPASASSVAELALPCKVVREALIRANPVFESCME